MVLLTILAAQEPPPAGTDAEEFRNWADVSGKYTTEAVLLKFANGEVHLRKRDGSVTRVPIGKLSREDQRYVRAEAARRKQEAAPPVRARKTAAATASVDAWPGWRGAQRDGKSPDTGLLKEWPEGGPPLLWKTTGIGRGYASVSVVDGTIYTTGGGGTGATAWRPNSGPAPVPPPSGDRASATRRTILAWSLRLRPGAVSCAAHDSPGLMARVREAITEAGVNVANDHLDYAE